ncbi:TetR/AcrR family transcriptional regulator [Paenibacillus segetis]|uniref:TetR family transcriptional regulator n=1 Tax=Paenibacillus segetis TaxID=1325360 RepID=A0ABQ1Y343_9BACL|nr:TetR/AcrR family transcriptional regulator [Paenibacillus segetis]GGH10118.1 TetR family transcriptional regulator [Paenibacillus segetis]
MSKSNLFHELHLPNPEKQTEKQKRIIEEAIRLFAEKGYSNTSTAEIAKSAEVSEASIFKQYGTKDKLLLSLIIPYFKEIFPAIADEKLNEIMSVSGDFEGFLLAFLKNRSEFITENKEIFQVFIKEVFYKDELKNELIPYFSEVVPSRLLKIIEFYKERGELIDIPSDQIFKMLITFVGGFFASRFVLLNTESVSDNEIADVVRFIMNGIKK